MQKKILWKIGGEAGFGIATSGLIFSRIAVRLGYHVFDYIEYPSLIRGGHNAFESCFSDEPIHALKNEIDFLVCLNEDTFRFHQKRLTSSSYVIYGEEEFKIEGDYVKISVPFKKILQELQGQIVMKNTITLGAMLAIMGADLAVLLEIIEKQFAKKGEVVVNFNKKFAKYGADYVKTHYSQLIKPVLTKRESENKVVFSGNDAFSFGAVAADCRLYAAYPMTPSSSVLTTLALWQEKTGMIVRHAEDEISVINTALGSSWAGVRSAVGTSGGGFALMMESVSLAGVAEIPVVIFLAQRPGPATGMPTWTEQGDLLFAVHAGHGEFPKIVLSPGDQEEMVSLTTEAFDLADIYQTPVIIISDMLLSEGHKSVSLEFINKLINEYKPDRGKIINKFSMTNDQFSNEKYLRYQLTEDGISPMLIPGEKGYFYQSNSYEHSEDGHTTEDAKPRVDQVNKRNKKAATYLQNHFQLPKIYGEIEKASTVFVSWGSSKGPILEAMKTLKDQGKETALIHFTHVYPLDEEKIKPIFKQGKRYVLVENNSQGQLGKLLRSETGINLKEKLLKYDGRPFWPEEIASYVTQSM